MYLIITLAIGYVIRTERGTRRIYSANADIKKYIRKLIIKKINCKESLK